MTTTNLPASTLTKNQTREFTKVYKEGKDKFRIAVTVRHDDQCGNGHNTFSVTADIRIERDSRWAEYSGGMCHEAVAKHFPEIAPYLKWHLTSTDGPMHYLANAEYHALQHGPTHAWVYYTGPSDPLNIGERGERLIGYVKAEVAVKAERHPDYRVEWDMKTTKERNLAYARSSAVWPDATDEDLTAPGLRERLLNRLPALMAEFKAAVESFGMTY